MTLGGIAHGIGAALLEEFAFDGEGQLLAQSFMDYLLPSAHEVPEVEIVHHVTPSPHTVFGQKGSGESGYLGAPAALSGAINDAVRHLDIRFEALPMRISAIGDAIAEATPRQRRRRLSLIIDSHAHLVPPPLARGHPQRGRALSIGARHRGPRLARLLVRRRQADAAGVQAAVRHRRRASPGWTRTASTGRSSAAGSTCSATSCRRRRHGLGAAHQRAALAAAAKAEPRFVPLATVPLQDGAAAAEVLRAAIAAGFPGVMIGTLPRGVGSVLDAPDLAPFWQAADDTGAVVHIHPSFDAGDVRVNDYGLANAVGRITDALIAVSRLISAGHVARYAKAKIVVPMGSAGLPFLLGRLARNHAITPGLGDPAEALRHIYTDTILHDPRVLRFVVDMVGRRPHHAGLRHAVPDRRHGAAADRGGGRPVARRMQHSINGGLAQRAVPAAREQRVARIEPLAGGVANDVWSVRVNGHLAVGRLGARSDADLAWETELLQHLDREGLTVPVPIPTTDGRLFADGVVVMTYVEGGPPETEADWRRVADTLRQLHRLTPGWPQRPGWRSSTDLLHAETGTKIDLGAMPPEGVARCRAAWARLVGRQTCVVHGDPNPRNIRMTADRVALIDWDEAHVDVPDLDLVLPHNAAGLDDGRTTSPRKRRPPGKPPSAREARHRRQGNDRGSARARSGPASTIPHFSARCIPGCREMRELAPDKYAVRMDLKVASVGGSFAGEIALSDKTAPQACRIAVSGSGTLGHGTGEARFTLEPAENGTLLAYDGAGEIGGLVAGVGQRVLRGVSKHLIGKFFKSVRTELEGAAAVG